MIRVLLYLWTNFGLDTLQLGIISFFGWKILTNHFAHLQADIASIKDSIDKIQKSNNAHAERISTIEGKLS